MIDNTYAFTLGREWKLSLAELFAVFGEENYISHTEIVALFRIHGYSDEQLQKKFLTLGGSVRIIRIVGETTEKSFATDVIHELKKQHTGGKVTFALGSYGVEFRLSDIGLRIKKTLMEDGHGARIANIENKNINAAAFKKERLAKTLTEYNLLVGGEKTLLGVTLACQDIDAYAMRDTAKSRDMVVGMMPPKLVQMMIHLARSTLGTQSKFLKNKNVEAQKNFGQELTGYVNDGENFTRNDEIRHFSEISIYDPFCGLGTTLIEGANMGILHLFGSDVSRDMVRATEGSLADFIATERMWQERIRVAGGTPNKDFSTLTSRVFELDARDIEEAFTRQGVPLDSLIVSEGYLGEIMSARDISLEKVQAERKKLAHLYTKFFSGLYKAKFRDRIVMSFPFWNIHGTYSYFGEIYDIIEKSGFVVESLLPERLALNTKKGSLLYRRENQTVGREIVKIRKK